MTETHLVAAPGTSPGAAPVEAALAAMARLAADDCGQDLIEYALIASFLGLSSIAGVNGLAAKIVNDLNIVVGGFSHATAHATAGHH